jgi:cytochrome c peroxidase
MKPSIIGLISLFLLSLSACLKEDTGHQYEAANPSLPAIAYNYSEVSDPRIKSLLQNREVTNHGATLGRVLFYDPALSRTNTISCGSCHFQSKGFADGVFTSTGFDGQQTTRNSIGFSNLAAQTHFFWDGRENDLKSMATKPIENHIEMGLMEMPILVSKLEKRGFYDELFLNAFGSKQITTDRIADAISQFLNSVSTASAPIDTLPIDGNSWWDNTNIINRISDPQVKRGAEVFFVKGNCVNCHISTFTSSAQVFSRFGNIGLDSIDTDPALRFKTPSLRNISLTGPYMHDGRFTTLREVIDHYSEGIKSNPNLSWELGGPQNAVKFNFTEQEKVDLQVFLEKMFLDTELTTSPKFSDPFK